MSETFISHAASTAFPAVQSMRIYAPAPFPNILPLVTCNVQLSSCTTSPMYLQQKEGITGPYALFKKPADVRKESKATEETYVDIVHSIPKS